MAVLHATVMHRQDAASASSPHSMTDAMASAQAEQHHHGPLCPELLLTTNPLWQCPPPPPVAALAHLCAFMFWTSPAPCRDSRSQRVQSPDERSCRCPFSIRPRPLNRGFFVLLHFGSPRPETAVYHYLLYTAELDPLRKSTLQRYNPEMTARGRMNVMYEMLVLAPYAIGSCRYLVCL